MTLVALTKLQKYLKAAIITTVGLFYILLLTSPSVSAQQTDNLCSGANLSFSGQGCNQVPDPNNPGHFKEADIENKAESKVNHIIAQIVNIFSVIVGVAAVIMIIYGGFRYVVSGGDSGNITTAKNSILYAIIGLIIVAFAQFIVKFILVKINGA